MLAPEEGRPETPEQAVQRLNGEVSQLTRQLATATRHAAASQALVDALDMTVTKALGGLQTFNTAMEIGHAWDTAPKLRDLLGAVAEALETVHQLVQQRPDARRN